jgi:hypothetical protein
MHQSYKRLGLGRLVKTTESEIKVSRKVGSCFFQELIYRRGGG